MSEEVILESDKVLNLGCGNHFYGTHRVDKFQTKAATHVFDIEDGIPFPDDYFNIVFERNLLEHLKNVGFHLSECRRVLKKGGKFILITDNAACIRYYLFGTHMGRYEQKHRGDQHYSIFTPSHVENHLREAGFTIIRVGFESTNTYGKFADKMTNILLPQISHPRIRAEAAKC